MNKYDAIIIGFGKGGKTLANYLAAKGEKVALIEKSKMMYGGTCINVGCIPSKSLVTSSKEAKLHSDDSYKEKSERYLKAIEEKRKVTSFLREKNYLKLKNLPNVTIYDGVGSFVSSKEVEVKSQDESVIISSDKIFINTGSSSFIPPIEGIKDNKYVFNSESLMDNDVLPQKLVIIGAGYIGMEFASMYANFGSQVTVIQDGDVFLPREDSDISDEIKSLLEKQGISFIKSAKVMSLDGKKVTLDIEGKEETIKGDAILIATGRRPNISELHLEKAGIEVTSRGGIKVDNYLRTNKEGIWALGDVNSGLQFTYISLDDFRIVKDQLEGIKDGRSLLNRSFVPYSVFMDTPLGRVGITEKQAQEEGYKYMVKKIPVASIPKAQVLRQTGGILKAVINKDNDEILGVSLLCPEAYEIINIVSLGMSMHVKYQYLRDFIYTHPTMSESLNDLFSL